MSSYEFVLDGNTYDTDLERDGDILRVTVGDNKFELTPIGRNLYSTTVNGHKSIAAVAQHKGVFYVDIDSVLLDVSEPNEDASFGGAGDAGGAKDKIFAPMPGKIVKLSVEVGDEVSEGQPVVIVEAMKMENQVNARAAGVVKAVNFSPGDQVDTETPIVELELAVAEEKT